MGTRGCLIKTARGQVTKVEDIDWCSVGGDY